MICHMTRNLRPTLVALLTIASCMVPATVAMGVGDREIPGVPLRGSVVSADVGGAISDRVYSIEVAAGAVVVATVVGDLGAELGLYMFGAEAETVLASEPIAFSSKPGGTQMIRMVFPIAETIYLNVNGRNEDRPHRFTLSVSVVVDTSPPRILVARPSAQSRPSSICARVEATDPLAGVSSVAVVPKVSGVVPDWVQYVGIGRYCGSYDVAEGSVTVRVLARNQLGYVSSIRAGVTTVDRTTPEVGSPTPRVDVVLVPFPVVKWRFSEPVKGLDGGGVSLMAFDQLGNRLQGASSLSTDGSVLTWSATRPIAPGVLVNVQVPGVMDLAGNVLAEIEPFFAFRKLRTSLQIDDRGEASGRLLVKLTVSKNLLGQTIQILGQSSGGTDLLLRTVKVLDVETYVRVRPGASTRVKAVWPGNETLHRAQDSMLPGR